MLASLFSIASNYFVLARQANPSLNGDSVEVDFWFSEVVRQYAESQ